MATNSSVDKRSITSFPSIQSNLNELLKANGLGDVKTISSNPDSLQKLQKAFDIKKSQSQATDGRHTQTSPPAPSPQNSSPSDELIMRRSSKPRS